MNEIKKILGVIWILMAPAAVIFLIRTALTEIEKKPEIDTKIQWSVFLIVFIPIAIGFVIFGYYALIGEYNKKEPK